MTVSPGMVNTGLWFQTLTSPVRSIALRTPEDAAQGIIYAIAAKESEEINTGSFLVDGRVEECSEKGKEKGKASSLWTTNEELIRRALDRTRMD